jgi:hypothetical protein
MAEVEVKLHNVGADGEQIVVTRPAFLIRSEPVKANLQRQTKAFTRQYWAVLLGYGENVYDQSGNLSSGLVYIITEKHGNATEPPAVQTASREPEFSFVPATSGASGDTREGGDATDDGKPETKSSKK